jgi:hypothetical protein
MASEIFACEREALHWINARLAVRGYDEPYNFSRGCPALSCNHRIIRGFYRLPGSIARERPSVQAARAGSSIIRLPKRGHRSLAWLRLGVGFAETTLPRRQAALGEIGATLTHSSSGK